MIRISEVKLAVGAYKKVPGFIRKHKLWMYLIVPGIIHVGLLIGMFFLARYFGDYISSYVMDWFDSPEGWLQKTLAFLFSFGVKFILFFIYALIYKNLVLVILSPMLAILSEKVDSIVTGVEYKFEFGQFLRDVWRGILMALRCLFYELLILFVISLFTWIFAPILAFFVSAYYWGAAMVDYSSERKRWNLNQRLAFIRSHRGLALGNGVIFYLLFLIPFIGWIIAPSFGIIAATLAVIEREKLDA